MTRGCVCVCPEVLEVAAFVLGSPQTLILEGGKWGTWATGTREVTRHGFSESHPLGGGLGLQRRVRISRAESCLQVERKRCKDLWSPACARRAPAPTGRWGRFRTRCPPSPACWPLPLLDYFPPLATPLRAPGPLSRPAVWRPWQGGQQGASTQRPEPLG